MDCPAPGSRASTPSCGSSPASPSGSAHPTRSLPWPCSTSAACAHPYPAARSPDHAHGSSTRAHKGPERVYVIHIGGERHMYRVIRVGVRADVVDAKGPEHLLPERRGQPMRAVLDIVVGDNPWHKASSAHASADRMPERAYPVGLRRK